MTQPSARLLRRVHEDYPPATATLVVEALSSIPESLPMAGLQGGERLQAAVVLPARGNYVRVLGLMALAREDWRDLLVTAGLADEDWRSRLDEALGPA